MVVHCTLYSVLSFATTVLWNKIYMYYVLHAMLVRRHIGSLVQLAQQRSHARTTVSIMRIYRKAIQNRAFEWWFFMHMRLGCQPNSQMLMRKKKTWMSRERDERWKSVDERTSDIKNMRIICLVCCDRSIHHSINNYQYTDSYIVLRTAHTKRRYNSHFMHLPLNS